jgi:hypothetical protein
LARGWDETRLGVCELLVFVIEKVSRKDAKNSQRRKRLRLFSRQVQGFKKGEASVTFAKKLTLIPALSI